MGMEAPLGWSGTRQRRAPRVETSLDAGLRQPGDVRRASRIANISRFGFKAETDGRLPIDALIWLKLCDGEPQLARVVWSDEGAAGCAFVTPLAPDMFRDLLRVTGLEGTIIE